MVISSLRPIYIWLAFLYSPSLQRVLECRIIRNTIACFIFRECSVFVWVQHRHTDIKKKSASSAA